MHERVRPLNNEPVRPRSRYVLYWMRANRRATFNHALAFAVELANEHSLPLLCYESLEENTEPRFSAFVLDGVAENSRCMQALGAGYVFHPASALDEFAPAAGAIVTDDFPTLPDPPLFPVAAYDVDASCIVPMSEIPARQYAAYAIRPKIHKLLPRYLRPVEPIRLRKAYPSPSRVERRAGHTCGGASAAEAQLERFLAHNLRRYAGYRNDPTAHATSELSPYLHYGHISALEVALRVKEYAARHKLIADEFLEQLIVRRELAFNFARTTRHSDSLDALPDWAQRTLAEHASDPRPALYSRDDFVNARTHDPLWNATQTEMLRRGVIHGYCRMYWGKKILEWSASPEEALATAIHIHDRFALDGRDPNTYANILWCFGLHDRPWPERPVFGTVRSMTLAGMERKIDVAGYISEMAAL